MTTPRPIEPSEIRVGDRVRMVQDRNGDQVTADMTVEGIAHANWLSSAGAGVWQLNLDGRTWTLLHRPEPPREPGSRWRDPETGAEYVRTDETDDNSAHYVAFKNRCIVTSDNILIPSWVHDRDIIARLVPLDGTR